MRLTDVSRWPRSTQVAVLALAASLLLDATLVARLLWPSRQEIAFEPLVIRTAPRIIARSTGDAELIRQAENRAPFGGTAPVSIAAAVVQQAPVVRMPRLIGTVVEGRAGFVIMEMPDARMQVVRIGERAGDLRLRSVTAGEAVFEDRAGARITLRSPNAGMETRP